MPREQLLAKLEVVVSYSSSKVLFEPHYPEIDWWTVAMDTVLRIWILKNWNVVSDQMVEKAL